MNSQKPKRYYMQYDHADYVTDSVTGSDGQEHIVTMRGLHWHNLDWLKKNTTISEALLVDISYIGQYGKVNGTLSESLEATLYYFIIEWDKQWKSRKSKNRKERTGSA